LTDLSPKNMSFSPTNRLLIDNRIDSWYAE
jgi:hypothetical protein